MNNRSVGRLRRLVAACTFSTLLCAPLDAQDWSSWGGPNANFKLDGVGAFPDNDAFSLRIVWKREIGDGYSSVSVANGIAVTMYSDGESDYVIALNPTDGSDVWQHRIGEAYLGHWGSQNGPLSTPLITASRVIALSPQGVLFSLDRKTGERQWQVDIVEEQDGRTPFWGFTTSPRLVGDLVVVQSGGPESNAISAYAIETGEIRWTAATDLVDYQTYGIHKIGGKDQIVFHGNQRLYGIDPATGWEHWEFIHGGANSASSTSSHPVETSEGRLFIKNSGNGGMLVQVEQSDDGYNVETLWRTRNLGGTYMYPVHHGGVIYGYKGRILTALDANTGDRLWRSREPGDGLPLIIDDHLITMTKEGALSIAPTSNEGFKELARLQVFEDIVWSPACYAADGKFYARSMGEVACVEVVPEDQDVKITDRPGRIPGTQFATFIKDLEEAQDKRERIEGYLKTHPNFPVIEGDSLAHFVYVGNAEEVAITGDHIGRRIDIPMHRAEGTNLFYYSSKLVPDARITYRYRVDLQMNIPDPRNENEIRSLFFGRASWFGMPDWEAPGHLSEPTGARGKTDQLTFVSAKGDTHNVSIYTPPGYDTDSDQRYPVVYVHDARRPFVTGMMDIALDNLIADGTVAPTVVVMVPAFVGGGYRGYVGTARRDQYLAEFVGDLIPFIDREVRTIDSRDGRSNYGLGRGGFMASYASLRHPERFSGIAVQSIYWDQTSESERDTVIPEANSRPPLSDLPRLGTV